MSKIQSDLEQSIMNQNASASVDNKNPYFFEFPNGDCVFLFEMQLPIGN
jgi:hypothetical protein